MSDDEVGLLSVRESFKTLEETRKLLRDALQTQRVAIDVGNYAKAEVLNGLIKLLMRHEATCLYQLARKETERS